jgi:hypothetical protein
MIVEIAITEKPMRMPNTDVLVGICDRMAIKGSMNILPSIRTMSAFTSEMLPFWIMGPRIDMPALGLAT